MLSAPVDVTRPSRVVHGVEDRIEDEETVTVQRISHEEEMRRYFQDLGDFGRLSQYLRCTSDPVYLVH